ncbi:hypothetical protein BAMY6639_09445 [Bacillus amyloliquefaciens UMAF6639]|nr:hypothetical protein BAMY6639_09445 [Bacillus amyloliquefaciens UMAF6639]
MCVLRQPRPMGQAFLLQKINDGKLEQNAGQIQGCFQITEPI